MNNAIPISPIGKVNLKTGANEMFGTVWGCWPESSGALILVRDVEKGSHRLCFTSGTVESTAREFPPFSHMDLVHDQTRRRLGGYLGWNVVGVFPYTKQGLLDIRSKLGLSSVVIATFK